MEMDQVVTWLKAQMMLRELRALAGRPTLAQKRVWKRRKTMCARIKRVFARKK